MRSLLFVSLIIFASPLLAETYPEYDGIYVFDEKKAQWISVDLQSVGRIGIAQSSKSVKDPRFKSNEAAGIYNLMSVPLVSSTVATISPSRKIRIFVRGRNPEIDGIVYLADAMDMAATVPDGGTVMSDGTPPGFIFDARVGGQASPRYIVIGNGRYPNDFKVRTIDGFSSEYILDPWNDFYLTGFKNCLNCKLETEGFAILTREYMISGDAKSAYVVVIGSE